MEITRLIMAAMTGALFGGAIVAGLAATGRVMAADGPRFLRQAQSLPAGIAIVLACTLFYGFVGTMGRAAPAVLAQSSPLPDPALALPTGPASFDVGGVMLGFNPPTGYCLYPDDMMQQSVNVQAKANPDNIIDAVFGDCGQLRAHIGTGARIHDFGIVMTPKATQTRDFDAATFDQTVAAQIDPATLKETIDQRLGRAQGAVTMQSFAPLGMIERAPGIAYFAFIAKANQGDDKFNQVCLMAMAAVRGRLVTYYLYADYATDARGALLTLLQKAKDGVAAFAQLNGGMAAATSARSDAAKPDAAAYITGSPTKGAAPGN